MSRVGRKQIVIEDKVKVALEGSLIKVEGPKGKFSRNVDNCLDVKIEDKQIFISRKDDTRRSRAIHGLTRALVQNMVIGVSTGFTRELEFTGVGYRATQAGNTIVFNLGYSHPIMFELPEGVSCDIDKNKITLKCSDKQVLGEAAATIRSFRGPEPYKGKGLKYLEEHIRRKEGKKMIG